MSLDGSREQARAGPVRWSSDPEARWLSPWWWLALPVAVAVAVIAIQDLDFDAYKLWISDERRGLLEFSHVVIPLAGLAVALRILAMKELRRRPLLYAWVGAAALSCLYVAGEEASWGQHYFHWSTPEYWRTVNDQEETNLHNASSWFDQKPRTLLELGILVGGIAVPLAALLRPGLRRSRLAVILPPLLCLPSALLAEGIRVSDRALSTIYPGHWFLFERPSEMQEFYFYYFVLLYLIVLRRRLHDGLADDGLRATASAR